MSLAFGIGLPVVQQVPALAQAWEAQAGPAEIARVAGAADRLGFAWVGCSDHVAVPASFAPSMGATWYDPATTLAFVAASTTRVRLLSHVLVLPYRHPLQAAKLYATLDCLSGGRVIIGAGSGHLEAEFRALGADHAERAAITDEYLTAIAVALEHERSSFAGRWASWRDMLVAPRPVQRPRPPLWVGGNSAAAARRAGRLGDGWIPWRIDAGDFAARAELARAAHAASGRNGPFTVVAPLAAGRVESPQALVDAAGAWQRRGATALHVGVRHDSVTEMLDVLDRFATEVIRRFHPSGPAPAQTPA